MAPVDFIVLLTNLSCDYFISIVYSNLVKFGILYIINFFVFIEKMQLCIFNTKKYFQIIMKSCYSCNYFCSKSNLDDFFKKLAEIACFFLIFNLK